MKLTGKPTGRPSSYTPKVADEILTRLAEGETLLEICRDDHLPNRTTVQLWVIDDREGFSSKYAQARAAQMERMAEEIVGIADDGTNDWMTRQVGDEVVTVADHEHIQRSKLRVDARKWLLSKLAAHTYGDKVSAELTGKDGKDLMPAELDTGKAALLILNILHAAKPKLIAD